jgi:hypothetical protein
VIIETKAFMVEFQGLLAAYEEAARLATMEAALVVQRSIQQKLTVSSAGSDHKGTRKSAPPSAPGTPPRLHTGSLRRSVRVKGGRIGYPAGGFEAQGYGAEIGPTIVYARIQELGGYAGKNHASYLPPRPYVEPAFVNVAPQLAEIYRRKWAEVAP